MQLINLSDNRKL